MWEFYPISSSPTEAKRLPWNDAQGSHLKQWPCLESKGINTVKLATLWAILSGTEIRLRIDASYELSLMSPPTKALGCFSFPIS